MLSRVLIAAAVALVVTMGLLAPAFGDEVNVYKAGKGHELPATVADQFSPDQVQSMIDQYQSEAGELVHETQQRQVDALQGKGSNTKVEKFARHIRQSLGIQPSDGQLIIFVSMSMSKNLIRSYLQEGAWAGAQVVVRGVPAGMTLMQYIKEVTLPLVQGRPGAGIRIDPRQFDIYGVETVPTIVWQPGEFEPCVSSGEEVMRKDEQGEPQPVTVCAPASREYWKVAGSVTVDWALREFARAGAEGAEKRLAILQDNVAKPVSKVQEPFDGDWSQAALPGEKYNPIQPNKNPVLNYTRGLLSTPIHSSPDDFEQ